MHSKEITKKIYGTLRKYLVSKWMLTVLVSVSVFMALSTVFHSINPPDNFPLSHSVPPVLFLPYW